MSIRRIAKEAQVSTTTVSRVINNHPYVSEELRNKVLKVMEEINYIPNKNAVNLSNGESGVIGLVVPYTKNSCYDQLVEGVFEAATKQQKKVLMLPTYFNKELENDYFTLLRDKTVDGIIVTSKTHDDEFLRELSQYGPVVTTEKTTIDNIPTVYPDRESIYHDVFSYIKSLTDIKQIVITVNRDKNNSTSAKLKADICKDYFPDLDLKKTMITHVLTENDSYEIGRQLFLESQSPLLIYCNGDDIASGFHKAALEQNLVINKDYYLIGENNQLISSIIGFPTIDFNLKEVGKQAVMSLINGTSGYQQVPCKLITNKK